MLGKGAGKDLMCSYVLAWLSCIILCLEDPLGYFEFPTGESLDMMNVACSADQANKVFFTKLKQRMSRLWFQRFSPKISDGIIEFPGTRPATSPGRVPLQVHLLGPNAEFSELSAPVGDCLPGGPRGHRVPPELPL